MPKKIQSGGPLCCCPGCTAAPVAIVTRTDVFVLVVFRCISTALFSPTCHPCARFHTRSRQWTPKAGALPDPHDVAPGFCVSLMLSLVKVSVRVSAGGCHTQLHQQDDVGEPGHRVGAESTPPRGAEAADDHRPHHQNKK